MSNVTIANLPDVGALTGAEFLAMMQGGVTSKSTLALLTAFTALSAPPPGAVGMFAMSAAPTGWLKANGALVNRVTYAALFAAIGDVFGAGDGTTTFALPDLRGEFMRGFDDTRGIDSGRVFGSAQVATSLTDIPGIAWPGNLNVTAPDSSTASGSTIWDVGGRTSAASTQYSVTTRPRNIALLACIKY